MKDIAIELISVETIKPRLNDDHRPFKICLLDQIAPRTYVPFILFFHNIENATDRLKTSLAEALTAFYPFSGRLADDNLFVDDFHAGVPFKTARLDCPMSVFLNKTSGTHMPTLNQFLPFRPFCNEKSTPDMPQVAVHLTRFSCGGAAVGVCTSHKFADIATAVGFLNGWAAFTRGDDPESASRSLDLHGGAWRFPAVEGLMSECEDFLFVARGRDMRTERFVFDEEALARLKSEAKSDVVSSRVQSLAAFIWKSTMAAAKTVSSSSSSRTQVMNQVVSIRPRNLKNEIGPTTDTAVGNLYRGTNAIYNNNEWGNPNLSELAKLGSESVSKINNDCMRSVRGNEAVDLVLGELKKTEMLSTCEDVSEVLMFSSWVNMGLKDVDFGFGRPKWVAVYGGEGGPELTNCVVLNDATWCNGIEVWVNLDAKVLDVLKNDREFLAFAVVDPPVID